MVNENFSSLVVLFILQVFGGHTSSGHCIGQSVIEHFTAESSNGQSKVVECQAEEYGLFRGGLGHHLHYLSRLHEGEIAYMFL